MGRKYSHTHMVASVNPVQCLQMQEQLVREITCYERNLEQLKINGEMDASLLQTYREMLHVRRNMLRQLTDVSH